jgi:dehydrogenase/reductase SDR family protein 7B
LSKYFNNKIVWITGASSGIGQALAIELSKKDAFLILTGRDQERLESTQKQLKDPINPKLSS